VKTLTRDEMIELTTAVMKAITTEVDLDAEQLDMCINVVSQTLVKSLQAAGYELPWVRTRRH
jgi:hypothetical protein